MTTSLFRLIDDSRAYVFISRRSGGDGALERSNLVCSEISNFPSVDEDSRLLIDFGFY